MIAFDTNVLIYALEANPIYGQKAEKVLLRASSVGGVCSTVLITELMYGTIDNFDKITPLQSPEIKVVPVDLHISELAGKLKIKYQLKTTDAIHIATALAKKASHFVTNDLALTKLRVKDLEILTIEEFVSTI